MTIQAMTKGGLWALAAIAVAAMLLVSPVAFAHDNDHRGDDKRGNHGLHLGSWFKAHLDTNDDGEVSKDEREAKRHKWADLPGKINVGVVTSVSGSGFTIDPAGNKSTTTVTTNSDTTVKGGDVDDIEVGTRVVVVGTTTASTTSGDTVVASWIKMVGEGFGRLGLWLGLR